MFWTTKAHNGPANCFIDSRRRIRLGDKINLLPAQISLRGALWAGREARVVYAKIYGLAAVARTIYLIHIQISDSSPRHPRPTRSTTVRLHAALCLRLGFIFIELQKISSP